MFVYLRLLDSFPRGVLLRDYAVFFSRPTLYMTWQHQKIPNTEHVSTTGIPNTPSRYISKRVKTFPSHVSKASRMPNPADGTCPSVEYLVRAKDSSTSQRPEEENKTFKLKDEPYR